MSDNPNKNGYFVCDLCGAVTVTKHGLKKHRDSKKCKIAKEKGKTNVNAQFPSTTVQKDVNPGNDQNVRLVSNVELRDQNMPNPVDEIFTRGFGRPLLNLEGSDVETVWYKRWSKVSNLSGRQYILPGGAVGKQFVQLLTHEIQAVINGVNSSEKIFVLCASVLQKDASIVTGCDVRRLLKKRMEMWTKEQFDELVQEAIRCNKRFKQGIPKCDENHKIRVFTRMVLQGKLRDATRWLTDRSSGGVHKLNDVLPDGRTVFEVLQEKHPEQLNPDPNLFLSDDPLPALIDVDVSSNHIEKVARTLRGGAGPSGTDADQWKSMLLRYGHQSALLRETVASLVRFLANRIVDWSVVRALLCRRGVALDKNPGVRPIGIGEVLQRVCAKAMVLVTGEDVQYVCGSTQLSAGTKDGIEGAIHSISDLFDEEDDGALLLVDAQNAFNCISRPLTLWNARILWPRCSRFLFNTYQGYAVIKFRFCDEQILSKEGTTQGDPLAMLMYAVGVLPLINKLKSRERIQNWYADDSSCFGNLQKIKEWLELLLEEGPKWGYYPEPSKSYLIIKDGMQQEAEQLFNMYNVKIVRSHKFLGSMIGSQDNIENFVEEKVKDWTNHVKKFAEAAKKSPQPAFAAFIKSLQFEWNYIQRVVDCPPEKYVSLKEAIRSHFTPAILGREISAEEHELFSLPAKLGGLGIKDPVLNAEKSFEISKKAVSVLTKSIKTREPLDIDEHNRNVKNVLNEAQHARHLEEKQRGETIIASLPEKQRRVMKRIVEGNASQWLTVIPTSSDNYDLSPTQFRDALALRYGNEIDLPEKCDGCEERMSVCHALNCKKGGLVKHGHDSLRDNGAAIAKLAFQSVNIEPVIQHADERTNTPALIGDLQIVGLWEAGRSAFLDYRIVNADAASYVSQDWKNVLNNHAKEKHRKYDRATEDIRGTFTPMVCTTDGVIHTEFSKILSRVASILSERSQKAFSKVKCWIITQVQFSIIRAVNMRLRGTRRRIMTTAWEDLSVV
uniref:Reverse transcriptase domain-containing protein n=1 Tax=Cacopsylla melanoneura TaxID=428564 RepID=A0A8D8RP38_9HEMI